MNVNKSRFHLLFGQEDWASCTVRKGREMVTLAHIWSHLKAGKEGEQDQEKLGDTPSWDDARDVVTLRHLDIDLPSTASESALTSAHYRHAAVDDYGNVYYLDETSTGISVVSQGTGIASTFWSGNRTRTIVQGGFGDTAADGGPPLALKSLALTCEHYLVAAHAGGFIRFDLVGGGGPEFFAFPERVRGLNPASLAPASCGGLWLLDDGLRGTEVTQPILYRLSRDLAFALSGEGSEAPSVFQDEEGPSRNDKSPATLERYALRAAGFPFAVTALESGQVIILNRSREDGKSGAQLDWLNPETGKVQLLIALDHRVLCMALGMADKAPILRLAHESSNQAICINLDAVKGKLVAALDPQTIPMRRFGGRGLISFGDKIWYDSGEATPKWVPLVAQRRQFFAAQNSFVTPVFDSNQPQCVWDRIRLDACIPLGTEVRIEARASDDSDALEGISNRGWIKQPKPYLNHDGGEMAGKMGAARAPTDLKRNRGCFDLLLQNITGRYAQVKITMVGDGRFTPHLRALRLWYPRFSYSERFLPSAYREEPGPASFLERFLANMEGVNTVIEEKIAAVQARFDTRTVPADWLDWLASWHDMALDPRWDEQRRRLFIQYAPLFFNWRGTIKGLRLALKLGFDACIDETAFQLGRPEVLGRTSIRIIEGFTTRPRVRSFAAISQRAGLAGAASETWQLSDGAAGIIGRLAKETEAGIASFATSTGPLPLHAEGENEQAYAQFLARQFGFVPQAGRQEQMRWRAFQGTASNFGLPQTEVPDAMRIKWEAYLALPSRDRTRWQDFVRERYRGIVRLNTAWGSNWKDFAEIPIPDHLPANKEGIRDWLVFEGQLLPMAQKAHRFTVLLPRLRVDFSREQEQDDMRLAQRIIALEKPAHTVFDVRFHWAMNRLGEARLGSDTHLGQGSRAPELIPSAILGQAYIGTGFIKDDAQDLRGREKLAC